MNATNVFGSVIFIRTGMHSRVRHVASSRTHPISPWLLLQLPLHLTFRASHSASVAISGRRAEPGSTLPRLRHHQLRLHRRFRCRRGLDASAVALKRQRGRPAEPLSHHPNIFVVFCTGTCCPRGRAACRYVRCASRPASPAPQSWPLGQRSPSPVLT